ncbi:MAG TPA: DNA topoisomerase 3 [Holophagaceae bacterium]|nr:DNA topoisomerase 3 [Holophagaceae bacterium]
MRLIVAEKPSMGRAIAQALGLSGSGRNAITGQGLAVTWCVGHLVEALQPEGYDPALKSWRMEALPIVPEAFQYAAIERTKDQYETVAGWLNRKEVTEVVNATDAGREGELIFDLVYRLSGCTKPVKRLWTSSLTEEAIREAFDKLKPGEAYAGLRDAARSRQESDWLVGINATRAQTLLMRRAGGEGVYSVGRVQTPTLAILVNRELELRDFKPQTFWVLWAKFQVPEGTWKGKWQKVADGETVERFKSEAEARALAEKLAGHGAKVASVQAKTEKKAPELLYDLTALQKACNQRFGWSAERTLEIAQALYEKKVLSYPRTASRHLTKADVAKAPRWIKALADGQFNELGPFIQDLRKRWPVELGKRFVDDSQVEDHSALVPTEVPAQGLHGDEAALYLLVARRFLAAHWPDRIVARTTVMTAIEGELFKATGAVMKQLGWAEVDPPQRKAPKESKVKDLDAEGEVGDEDEEEDQGLPPLKKGQPADVLGFDPKEGKTSPPKRLSEADLLGAMQGAGRFVDDEALKGALKDRGLGTPATRASIIETLLQRGYAERKRTALVPTEKGIALIQSIPDERIKSPQLTGEWEAKLESMRRGETAREGFMDEIKGFVRDLIRNLQGAAPRAARKPVTGPEIGPCPRCGSTLRLRTWEQRTYARCDGSRDPECPVAFDCDAEGAPTFRCEACQGPVREEKSGRRVCLACRREQGSQAPLPIPCPKCAAPMRVIPSTRKGEFFHRCGPCGIVESVKAD